MCCLYSSTNGLSPKSGAGFKREMIIEIAFKIIRRETHPPIARIEMNIPAQKLQAIKMANNNRITDKRNTQISTISLFFKRAFILFVYFVRL